MIHYALHPGMLVRFMKGEYVGETRNVKTVLEKVSPHISPQDATHIERILMQGCPSHLMLSEPAAMKKEIIAKGNQSTFSMYTELVAKTMNKEEKHSHLIALKLWVLHFSPYCRSTAQGIQIKPGKDPRIIWDGSTKDLPHQIVLNEVTPTNTEAPIDFGKAKSKLLVSIYNWRISFPNKTIFIALADITACFRFARISADITGAFGFIAVLLYFLMTSHVFGSNTLASNWEPLRRAIETMVPVHMANAEALVKKHKEFLEKLIWVDPITNKSPAYSCPINQGVLQPDGNLIPPKGNIYVDDILSAGVGKKYVTNLLAATIESIFTVCGHPNVDVRQCPLSLKKWWTTSISPRQVVLVLAIDTNRMTVGLPQEYHDQVKKLLRKWPKNRKLFRAADMQKIDRKNSKTR
jgi:hypothetical protein